MALGTPALAVSPNPGATGTTITSASFTTPAGSLLLCMAVGRGTSAAIPTISDSLGGTWTPITAGNDAGTITSRLFTKVANGSAQTVTVTSTGATQTAFTLMQVASAEVVSSNIQMNTGASGVRSLTMNAFGAGSGCIYLLCGGAGTTWSQPTGYAELFDGGPATNVRVAGGFDISSPATAISTTPTGGTIDSTLYGIEIKEPAGVSVTTNLLTTSVGSVTVEIATGPTLNPADKSSLIVLSDGNLTATGNEAGNGWVRSTTAQTGKRYVEFTVTTDSAAAVGIADNSAMTYPGANDKSFALYGNGYGGIAGGYPDWGGGTPYNTYTSGDVVGMAVDLTAKLVWFRVNGSDWNGSESNEPTTGVGGIDVSAYTGATNYVVLKEDIGGVITVNFGATAFTTAAPSGFMSWMANPEGWDSTLAGGGTVDGTTFTVTAGSGIAPSVTTHDSGKWYAEVTLTTLPTGGTTGVGIFDPDTSVGNLWAEDSGVYAAPSATVTGSDPNFAEGDIISIAADLDALKFWVRKNGGTWQPGTPPSGTPSVIEASATFHVTAQADADSVLTLATTTFVYTPPSGFLPWYEEAAAGVNVSVDVTGQSLTTSVGNETVVGKASVSVTTNLATVSLGDETVVGKANVSLTTNLATTSAGTVTVETPVGAINVSVDVTGHGLTVATATAELRASPANMVSNISPSPYVVTSSNELAGYLGFNAFDGNPDSTAHSNDPLTTTAYWIKIDLGSSKPVSYYKYQARNVGPYHSWKTWVLEGSNDDAAWTLVDTVTNEPAFAVSEIRSYVCDAPATFRYWRWSVSATSGISGTYAEVNTLELWGGAPVSVTGKANVSVTGQQIAASVGTATAATIGTVNVTVATNLVAVSLGDETVSGKANHTVAGQGVAAATGTATATGKANVTAVTNLLTASVGNETVSGKANVTVIAPIGGWPDESLKTFVGNETVVGKAIVSITGEGIGTITGGVSVTAGGNISVSVSGLQVEALAGDVSVRGNAIVTITEGVEAPWTPDLVVGLEDWHDASQLGLADGASVPVWTNIGFGAVPSMVGTPLPVFKTGILNGLPVVRFSANEGRLRNTFSHQYDHTVVYIARRWGATAGRCFTAPYPEGGNHLIGYHTSGYDAMHDDGGWVVFPTTYPATGTDPWRMYGADGQTSVGVRFFRFGEFLGGAGTAGNFGFRYNISGYSLTGAEETGDFDVAEVLVYDSKIADADREKVEGYLAHKWGLQANLPVGHPYKSAAPVVAGGGNPLGMAASAGTLGVGIGKTVNVTGLSSMVSVGTVSVTATGATAVNVSGSQAAVSVGTASVVGKANVTVTGQAITASHGTVTATGKTNVSVTGQQIAASVGTVAAGVTQAVNVSVAGQQILASRGTVTVTAAIGQSVNVTGQQVAVSRGTVTATGKVSAAVAVTGEELAVEIAPVEAVIPVTVAVAGQVMAVSRGTASISISAPVNVSGAEAIILVGNAATEFDYTFELLPVTGMALHLGHANSPNWGWGGEVTGRENWTYPDADGTNGWIPVPGSEHQWQKPSSPEDEGWIKQTRQPNEWH